MDTIGSPMAEHLRDTNNANLSKYSCWKSAQLLTVSLSGKLFKGECDCSLTFRTG